MADTYEQPPYLCYGDDHDDLTDIVRSNAALVMPVATLRFGGFTLRKGTMPKHARITATCAEGHQNVFDVPIPVPAGTPKVTKQQQAEPTPKPEVD